MEFTFRHHTIRLSAVLVSILLLAACGGARVSKKWEQSQHERPILELQAQTASIVANLDWIVFRNGPGSWAKDAFWDEYIVSVTNVSDQPITIESLSVIDSTDTAIVPHHSRKALKKAYKVVKKRNKKAGLQIKLGEGSTDATGNSIVATALVAGGAGSGSVAAAGGTLTAAGGAIVVAVPAIAIGSVMKIVNNTKVNNRISEKTTVLPLILEPSQQEELNIFFPAVPSPQYLLIKFTTVSNQESIQIDLQEAFSGLHIKKN